MKQHQTEATDTAVATQEFKMPAVKLGVTAASIKKLAEKYPSDNVPDVSTKDGMLACKSALREISACRIGLEKKRKELVAGAVEWQKEVNGKANGFKNDIVTIEYPYRESKTAEEDRLATEKRNAEEAEEKRILAIEEAVESINELTADLLGANLEKLEKRLNFANKIVISDSVYMEFVEQASLLLEQKKDQLTNAVNTAKALAEQQKEIDKQQRVMDERKAEMDKKLQDIAEREDAIEHAENERLAEIQRLEEDHKAEIARSLIAELQKKEEERLAIEQEEADKQRAIDEQKTAAELKARLPEDIKLREYADALLEVEVPDITDPGLCAVLRDISVGLSDILDMVHDNTQKVS